nr:MAG TPA: hypothetical protein [Bacteriophage sp.]DAT27196.1 MAG TPA: hypothetical protein [Caudoviricetes sp.]
MLTSTTVFYFVSLIYKILYSLLFIAVTILVHVYLITIIIE